MIGPVALFTGTKLRDWLVHIRRNEHASLQTQIREALVSAILDGQLAREEPIPSTRKMAKSLGVSRNTVVLAYQGLLDDGYLVARERSGYYVSDKAIDTATPPKLPVKQQASGAGIDWSRRLTMRPADQSNVSKPLDWQSYPYPFIYGQVDHNAVSACRMARLRQAGAGQEMAGLLDQRHLGP